ncbi:MAG: hypothetical protein QME35_10340 [Thermoanaerobacteraceae bacterium]|nr:hypothetical protein [Thermoanaerobacteraceae bacterium]
MKSLLLLNKKMQNISFKQTLQALIIIFISISITVLSQTRLVAGNIKIFFESGFIMLAIIYLLKFVYLFPILIFIRLIRERGKYNNLLISSISIILWAFVPIVLA